jgi:hypothetical protein
MGQARAHAVSYQPLKTVAQIPTQSNKFTICAWQRILSECYSFLLSLSFH